MTLEEAINLHINAGANIFTNKGVYIQGGYELQFDKEEWDRHFRFGYYEPDYRKWLMENAKVTELGK